MDGGIKKTSQALSSIACELIDKNIGDRVEPFLSMAERLGVANGTVQNAIRTMEREKAVHLVSRGHLGSFISMIDYSKLLAYAGISSVYCAMPIPYSKRYEGLASGLRSELAALGLERSGIMFVSGSYSRITALLENRVDVAIMSSLAVQHYVDNGAPVEMLHKFPERSYINNHFLITRRDFDLEHCKKVRVGIDELSYDQAAWNSICFAGKEVIPVPVRYLHVLEHIKTGVIDAAVWSFEDSYFDDELTAVELHDKKMDENTAATLVVRRGDVGMQRFLNRNLDFNRIIEIQQAVMRGSMLPDY